MLLLAEFSIPFSSFVYREWKREPGKRKKGDCPNFRVNENGTVPFDALYCRWSKP
jgi:hypothetical protein